VFYENNQMINIFILVISYQNPIISCNYYYYPIITSNPFLRNSTTTTKEANNSLNNSRYYSSRSLSLSIALQTKSD